MESQTTTRPCGVNVSPCSTSGAYDELHVGSHSNRSSSHARWEGWDESQEGDWSETESGKHRRCYQLRTLVLTSACERVPARSRVCTRAAAGSGRRAA
eukprot:4772946-Pleurochrysis_carterae.AAC.1